MFFIKHKYARLQSLAIEVATRKLKFKIEPILGTKTALENSNHTYHYYTLATRTTLGRLLSFIPGTSAFQARKRCVQAIVVARIRLLQVSARLAVAERKAMRELPSRSQSEPVQVPSPKVYKSPYHKPPVIKGGSVNPTFNQTYYQTLRLN